MKIATLFSGIGAPEQAAARVWQDHEVVFACEWDKYARQSYLANYSIDEVHFHTDVKELDGTQYQGKVDVLIGGSPCQAFSIAGMRGGTDDERGQLIYQYVRVVDEVKAPVIVYENVKGMLSIDSGRTIKEFVEALREIGYYCHYEVLNTKDYGVPQNRERIFLVGFLDHEAYYRFAFAPKTTLEKRLKDVLELNVDEKYYLSETAIKGFNSHAERMAERGNGFKFEPTDGNTIVSSVTTRAGGRPDDNFVKVIGKLDIKGDDYIKRVYDDEGISPCLPTMQGGNQEPKIIDTKSPDAYRVYADYCPTLQANDYKEPKQVLEPKIMESFIGSIGNPRKGMEQQAHLSRAYHSQDRVWSIDGVSPTIMAQETQGRYHIAELKIIQKSHDYREDGTLREYTEYCPTLAAKMGDTLPMLEQDYRIRKLTPRECLRLQDFPDTFKQVVSDSQMYKQAGNSMTVAVVEMIFRQIDKALTKQVNNTSLFGEWAV